MLDCETKFHQSGKWKISYIFVLTNQWAQFVSHWMEKEKRYKMTYCQLLHTGSVHWSKFNGSHIGGPMTEGKFPALATLSIVRYFTIM